MRLGVRLGSAQLGSCCVFIASLGQCGISPRANFGAQEGSKVAANRLQASSFTSPPQEASNDFPPPASKDFPSLRTSKGAVFLFVKYREPLRRV